MKTFYLPILLMGCIFVSCNNSPKTVHETAHEAHGNHHSNDKEMQATPVASGEISEMSLYHLSSKWATEKGDSIELKALSGKTQIVAMIYTNCDYACPRTIADLKRIEESLTEAEREATGIVLVTLDPERDNPEKLKEYAQKNKLDPSRWTSLTSNDNNTMELAALLNVKYRKELSMDIAHSNIISVLNKEGELIHQQEGLGTDPSETVNVISSLVKKL